MHALPAAWMTPRRNCATTVEYKTEFCRDATCTSCGTQYVYFEDVKIRADAAAKVAEKLRQEIEDGVGIVPCPNCGKMNKAMWGQWIASGVVGLFMIALCAGGLVLVMSMFEEGAVLMWGLGLLCLGGLAMFSFNMLFWPLMPLINKGDGIMPDRLDKAKPAARAKYAGDYHADQIMGRYLHERRIFGERQGRERPGHKRTDRLIHFADGQRPSWIFHAHFVPGRRLSSQGALGSSLRRPPRPPRPGGM